MTAPATARPIVMTADSVVAINRGRKTQTRRLITLRQFGRSDTRGYDWTFRDKRSLWNDLTTAELLAGGRRTRRSWAPYRVGDLLWVRETYSTDALGVYPCPPAWYRADFHRFDDPAHIVANAEHPHCKFPTTGQREAACFTCALDGARFRWRSPRFMPRKLSRITLRVTDVRIEQVQAISEADAKAEGAERDAEPCDHTRQSCADVGCLGPTYRSTFATTWDAINEDRAPWETNPFVWALTFERTH